MRASLLKRIIMTPLVHNILSLEILCHYRLRQHAHQYQHTGMRASLLKRIIMTPLVHNILSLEILCHYRLRQHAHQYQHTGMRASLLKQIIMTLHSHSSSQRQAFTNEFFETKILRELLRRSLKFAECATALFLIRCAMFYMQHKVPPPPQDLELVLCRWV
jgi:hypothetical protein